MSVWSKQGYQYQYTINVSVYSTKIFSKILKTVI